MSMDNEPLGRQGSPFAVGVLALVAAGLSGLIYETSGTWPSEFGIWTVGLFVVLAGILMAYAWQTE